MADDNYVRQVLDAIEWRKAGPELSKLYSVVLARIDQDGSIKGGIDNEMGVHISRLFRTDEPLYFFDRNRVPLIFYSQKANTFFTACPTEKAELAGIEYTKSPSMISDETVIGDSDIINYLNEMLIVEEPAFNGNGTWDDLLETIRPASWLPPTPE